MFYIFHPLDISIIKAENLHALLIVIYSALTKVSEREYNKSWLNEQYAELLFEVCAGPRPSHPELASLDKQVFC